MVRVVDLDSVAVEQVRRKYDQIRPAGMTQRWEQDPLHAGSDDLIGKLPGRRYLLVDAGNFAPATIPLRPRGIPCFWIEAL